MTLIFKIEDDFRREPKKIRTTEVGTSAEPRYLTLYKFIRMKMVYKIEQIISIVCILLLSTQTYGQEAKWAKQTWGNQLGSFDVDEHGNCYVTGDYPWPDNTHDGVSLIGSGYSNIFTAKYNCDGKIIWASTTSSSNISNVEGSDICYDKYGNTYIIGFFSNSLTFDNIQLLSGSADFYIAKYDLNGKVLWAKQLGDYGYFIKVDQEGNCYISGSFKYPLIIGSTTINGINDGNGNILLAKLDSNGELKWVKTGKGSNSPDIKISATGELFICSAFQNYLKWGNDSIPTIGGIDGYIAKLNSNGDFEWFTHIGSSLYDYIYDFAIDSMNNLYIIGKLGNNVYCGDTLITGLIGYPFNVAKFDDMGKLAWITSFSADTSEYHTNKIIVDYSGNLYTFGEETEIIDSTNYWNYKSYGMLRHKFDKSDGSIEETRLYKDIPDARKIGVDRLGNYYLFGVFHYKVPIEDTIIYSTSGNYGMYIARLGFFENQTPHVPINSTYIYPNPSQNLINIQLSDDQILPTSFSLYDIEGRILLNKQLENNYSTIDISSLANGMYFTVLLNETKKTTFKIVKY